MTAGVCVGEGPRGCGPHGALLVMPRWLLRVAEEDVPKRQTSVVKRIAGGAVFERRAEAATISAPYLPPYLADFKLSMDPNVIWFKFFRFRLWPP